MEGTVPRLKIQDVPKEILDKITSIHKAPGVPKGNVYLVKLRGAYTCYTNPADHKEVLDFWIKALKDGLPKEMVTDHEFEPAYMGYPDGEGCQHEIEGHSWTIIDPHCCRRPESEHLIKRQTNQDPLPKEDNP